MVEFESFAVVGTQVFILFLLIGLGFFSARVKISTESGIRCINDIMLYLVTPCVIIHAFQKEFDMELLKNLLFVIVAAFFSHFLSAFLGFIFIRNECEAKRKVLRFAAIFSNCGFMALPLLDALLGYEGVFYGAGYLAVFNLLAWSYGQYMMAKGYEGFDIKKAILNPGVISVIIGFVFFVFSISLPMVIAVPIEYMSDINTPVAMLIIGYTISTLDLKNIFKIREGIVALLIRLLISPFIILIVLYLAGFRGTMLTACIVSSSAPVAATTTMFSIKYNGDDKLASKMVAVSTLFSIVTMTLIVGIAQTIAS